MSTTRQCRSKDGNIFDAIECGGGPLELTWACNEQTCPGKLIKEFIQEMLSKLTLFEKLLYAARVEVY